MVGMSKAKAEPKQLPKRFYAAANLQQNGSDCCITLDGKTVKTPMGKLLQHKSEKLMQQIAAEWEAQKEVINTDSMPLTRLLNIALDRVPLDRAALLTDIAGYCETDLLFYRVPLGDAALPIDTHAEELRQLQIQHFDPLIAWVKAQHNAEFVVTESIMPVPQPAASLQKLNALFAAATDHELAALAMLVPLLGSALLTLAVWQQNSTIEQALTAARLDETVQSRYWGEDAEQTAKWEGKARDAKAAAFFLTAN